MPNCLLRGNCPSDLEPLREVRAKATRDESFDSHGSQRERITNEFFDTEHTEHTEQYDYELLQHNEDFVFTDDELVELELLRDQETDTIVENGLLPKEHRWNVKCRQGYSLAFPEMTLNIITGDCYPVKSLSYEVKNISLPRVVVDQLRVALRAIHEDDAKVNTFESWRERESSKSGCFEFEMGALHMAAKATDHLKEYRRDPAYWRTQSNLQQTDYKLSLERRKYLRDIHGFDDLVPDDSDEENEDGKEKQRYDPFNPDWSKKATNLTNEQKLSLLSVQHKSEIMNSMFGIDPKSISGHDLANSIIGKTPEDVCDKISEMFRILHIESVVRSDLVAKFFGRQAKIRHDLEKLALNILKGSVKRETRLEMGKRANEPQTLIDHLVSPDLTFHCTRGDLVPSIVRQGFLKPDEKNVRCGSTYGRGIYSSPDPTFSLMYTDFRLEPTKFNEFASLKLIACATITGICRFMTRDDNWRHQNVPYPGAHCHAANDLLEYVVFDDAQIIPCYVIHLDLGRDAASYISTLSMNPTGYINQYPIVWRVGYSLEQRRKAEYAVRKLQSLSLGPGEEKRRKEALMARTRKYFPYGFGAASGSNFVVQAVGETSEDEEDFGVYQKDRLNKANDSNDIWTADDHTNFALDGEGHLDDEESDSDDGNDSNNDKSGDEITWEEEMGPRGRTRFDEFYGARKAKNKKQKGRDEG